MRLNIGRSHFRLAVCVTLVGLLMLGGCSNETNTGTDKAAQGPDPKAFYEGEVLHIVVGYDPGGGFDEYARMKSTRR